ncbi:cell division protein FtsL [Kineosphaera limosa]|nr:hypothetical protein [Kineosphaera limosa]NYE00704.1 cell division protein FtsL [Kineosphaera limosa]
MRSVVVALVVGALAAAVGVIVFGPRGRTVVVHRDNNMEQEGAA